MKKLGSYIGSVALGLTILAGGCDKSEKIPSETSVRLENITYYELDGNPVCLYYPSGRYAFSATKGKKGMTVSHRVLVNDGDLIKEIWQGRYEDGKHSYYELDKPKSTYSGYFSDFNSKDFFEKNPYKITVVDVKGNKKTFTFPLDYIKKHGRIVDHKSPNTDGKCDDTFD